MENFEEKLKALCISLHGIGALKFGDFKMKVGINSPVYFDLRVIISYPAILEELSELLWQFAVSRNIKPVVLCGVPYTALPITTLISVKNKIPMLLRRKEPKNYGTMKLIEGKFESGDECLIIEDVVTSGCSILETLNDLKKDGLFVKDTVVVIDREQGGVANLEKNGLNMHSLLTLSKVMNILCEAGKIDKSTVLKVNEYTKENQISPDGRPISKVTSDLRLLSPFMDRSMYCKCEIAKNLFLLMERKKSNLCIAIDVATSEKFLELVDQVGEHVAVVKTHYDAISDWDNKTVSALQTLAKEHDFLILEDRKYGDIGNTVSLQCNSVFTWADMVTLHILAGEGTLEGAKESVAKYQNKGIFLVAELSSKDNFISQQQIRTTSSLAVANRDIVAGLVCQSPGLITYPGLVQLTPGVSLNQGGDKLGQQYVTPEEAVIDKGGDLIVVGRAITQAEDPKKAAASFRETLWQAYLKRIL